MSNQNVEQSVNDFVSYCDGKISEQQYTKDIPDYANVIKVEHTAYGDMYYYKDRTHFYYGSIDSF